MKKFALFLIPLILAALACDLTVSVAPSTPPPSQPTNTVAPVTTIPTEPATPTPEIFIARTQAVPGDPQPTATTEPTSSAGTTISYGRLTLTIPQSVASGASGSELPRVDSADAAWWQKTPGHLQGNLGDYYVFQGKTQQPQISVYPGLEYAQLVPAAFESIHRLDNFLYAPNVIPALDQLPGLPFLNTKILFASQIQKISFQNGSGIRYLSEYAQHPASANNADLFYTFIGLSSDGDYYVVATFPVSNPKLAETADAGAPLPPGGIAYPYLADPEADMDAYYIAVTDLLNVQPADSFTPSLSQLDALIQSMQIAP